MQTIGKWMLFSGFGLMWGVVLYLAWTAGMILGLMFTGFALAVLGLWIED